MDRFEVKELIIVDVDAEREEEPRVASVDEFVRAELDKVGELGVSCCNEAMDLALKLGLLFVGVRAIVFAQPRLALPILQQYVLDHVPARHEAPGSHRLHWVGGGAGVCRQTGFMTQHLPDTACTLYILTYTVAM